MFSFRHLLFLICILSLNVSNAQIIFEEQFAGGIPASWDVGPGNPVGAVWGWSDDGRGDNVFANGMTYNSTFSSFDEIDSPSKANGCASYNGDAYDSNGMGVGQGPYPNTHTGTLTSPSVNCTGFSNVTLKFHQHYRFCCSGSGEDFTKLEVSNDGGSTWTDFPINVGQPVNAGVTNEVEVDISALADNQPDVRVRFTWLGYFYVWHIDDVILSAPATTSFTTVQNGPWSNPNTWDNGVPPEPIPAGTTVTVNHLVTTNGTASITNNGEVTVNADGTARIQMGSPTHFINNGTFNGFATNLGNPLFINDNTIFDNYGYFRAGLPGQVAIRHNGGNFNNKNGGHLDFAQGSLIFQDGDARFVNEAGGVFDLAAAANSQLTTSFLGAVTTGLVFVNAGTFNAFGNIFMDEGSGENSATGVMNIHNSWDLSNDGFTNDGIINTSSVNSRIDLNTTLNSLNGTINHNNNFFRGSGTVIIPTFVNNAILVPLKFFSSPDGILDITGNYDGDSDFRTFISGTTTSDYGSINVTGTANITQELLRVFFLSGFTPAIGDAFTIITAAAGVTGPFSSTSLPNLPPDREWQVNYNPNTVVLEVIATCNPPMAVCSNQTVQLDANGNASVSVSTVGAGSTAECGLASETVMPNSFTCSNIGPNTVTYTITDTNGASSQCTAVVTVEDNTDPTISCPMDIVVPNDPGTCEGTFTVPTPSADDNCEVTVLRYRWRPVDAMGNNAGPWSSWSTEAMQTLDVGNYKFQWQAKDASNNQKKCTFFVDIVDTEPPVAVCKNTTVEFNGQTEIILQASDVFDDINSSDNCSDANLLDFNPTSVTCDQLGMTVPVTVSVEDDASNPDQCTANVTVGGLPCGFSADPNGINCSGNMGTYNPATDTYMITNEGCYDPNYYSNSDSHGYLGTELCGDGEIIAEITSFSGDGFAGIAMREDLSAGSKMLQLSIDGVSLSKRELRSSTNGVAFNHIFQTQGKNWLRLTRSGNQFTAQHSTDGMNWSTIINTMISMPNCIEVGLFTENNTPSGSMTATFENVEVKSGNNGLQAPDHPGIDLAEAPAIGLTVYPNPTTGEAFIELDTYLGQPARIEIFNNLGQAQQWLEFDEIQNPTQRLDLSGYENGLYLIKVQIGDQPAITRKLMLVGTR